MINKLIPWFLILLGIFSVGFLCPSPANARNCGVCRERCDGNLPQIAILGGGNQVTVVSRGLDDKASPAGFSMRDAEMRMVTVKAGGHSIWHSHPGANFAVMTKGKLSNYTVNKDGSCTEHILEAGGDVPGFVELPGEVHAFENKSDGDAVIRVLLLNPEGHSGTDPASEVPTGPGCPDDSMAFGTADNDGTTCEGYPPPCPLSFCPEQRT